MLKRTGNSLKKSPIKRKSSSLKRSAGIRKKPKPQESIDAQKEEYEKDWQFFLSIWSVRPHKCEVTGEWLGNEPKSIFFDHLLPKGLKKYEHLRHEPKNIALVTGDIHACKDSKPHPRHLELIEQAKREFEFL